DPVAVAVDDLIAAGPRFVRAGPFTLAVAGLVTEETPRLVGRNALKGLHVGGELAAARAVRSVLRLPADRERAADASRPASAGRLDADGLLFVNHVARDRNLLLAREIPDADVIIGGHNHADPLATGVTAPSGALLAQAAATTRAFGAVRLEIDPETRRIRSKTARLRWIDGRPDAAVSRLAPIVKRYEDETAARMNVPVCVVPTALGRDPDPENPGPLGAWLGAAMRAASGAEVAVHNQGGIRADLPAGVARVREFFQVSPFGNRLVSATLKARDLRALAERTARAPGRGFVVVGLEVAARKTADGLQVVALRRNGEPLDDDAAVRVVTTDFLAFGGDAASPFGRATDLVDHDVTLLDATLAFARRSETLVAPPPARWTIVP
ncbi:MAG TPA: 5'-nucleotidase C-terminal domain-containing protein, partial [Planctomycetota bacterium]|nr:5'-nucleotidase C-terminal domain-containing protein [Planctomycetota bacterium]